LNHLIEKVMDVGMGFKAYIAKNGIYLYTPYEKIFPPFKCVPTWGNDYINYLYHNGSIK